MRYASAAAFRSALEAQVRLRSQRGGSSVVRLRKAIAFERLLARLLVVAPERWMLKGALALDFRLGVHARATMDTDLAVGYARAAAFLDPILSSPVPMTIWDQTQQRWQVSDGG